MTREEFESAHSKRLPKAGGVYGVEPWRRLTRNPERYGLSAEHPRRPMFYGDH